MRAAVRQSHKYNFKNKVIALRPIFITLLEFYHFFGWRTKIKTDQINESILANIK